MWWLLSLLRSLDIEDNVTMLVLLSNRENAPCLPNPCWGLARDHQMQKPPLLWKVVHLPRFGRGSTRSVVPASGLGFRVQGP